MLARPLLASAALLLAGALAPHPQDGPDVDVRLRVDPDAVEVALIVNLAFADELVDAPRENPAALHPLEHEALREALSEYFRGALVVEVDGVRVVPLETAFEVAEPDLDLLPLFPAFGTRALTKARLELAFPAKQPPQRVRFVWPAFPPDAVQATAERTPPMEIAARLLAGGVEVPVLFTQEEPAYTWHATAETYADRFLAVPAAPGADRAALPLLSVALGLLVVASGAFCLLARRGRRLRRAWALAAPLAIAAALTTTHVARLSLPAWLGGAPALPSEDSALAIFRPLHANIYRAFDYDDESDVYDALDQSVTGELLDRLYTEVHRSLVMQEEGGAVARVEAVTPLETDVEAVGLLPPDDAPGFTVRARWQVEGAVHHFGHSHWRTNEYEARYQVRATAAGWRISESEVLEAVRVDAGPGDARPVGPAEPPPGMPEEL